MKYDFSGWATRNDLRCSDGRTIMHNAFADNDGGMVPLVWNHDHKDAENVLGHALLENRDDGVYTYGFFNDTPMGSHVKELVKHGDVTSLSIYANKLTERGGNVYHGDIKEVSIVLAGANPGAYIDTVLAHSDDPESGGAIIYTGESITGEGELMEHSDVLEHADNESGEKKDGKTIKEVFDAMSEEQKAVVYALVGMAAQDKESNDKGEDSDMKHNVFDQDYDSYTGAEVDNGISHADYMAVLDDMKRYGSLKESALQHGMTNIDYLFPEPKNLNNPPEWINIKTDWVPKVMNGVHHTPFSRIKSQFADITGDEARALGYIKGKYKKEEVFTLLKRTTTPTTIYKKQKFDRDDIIDITDFEVIPWVKTEMRGKLDEELARAFLIGDGRLTDSDDHINEGNIRPIWKDEDLFTIKYLLPDEKPQTFIRSAIKSRIQYRGSGQPTLFITEDKLTDLLLLTDATGRDIYDSEQKLATKLRVSSIVTVPPMENAGVRVDSKTGKAYKLHGLIVNLSDYSVGADKGGAVNMFDDFDIDYNKMIYLIETRCSGALTKPYSAIALETEVAPPAEAPADNG
jgi:HK97 family phage prohead protease